MASIFAFGSTPRRSYAAADLTAAYPGEAERIVRGVEVLDRSRVLVEDELTKAVPDVPLHWAMLTAASIMLSPDGRTATLTQEGRRLRVDALSPTQARFRIGSTKPPTAAEAQNEGTAKLVLDVPAPALTSNLDIAVLLTPVGERWPVLPSPAPDLPSTWR